MHFYMNVAISAIDTSIKKSTIAIHYLIVDSKT